MCAIFGFVAKGTKGPKLETLAKIVRGNVARGPHAFGFAWIDSRGRLRMYKQTGRLTDDLGVLAMARDAQMLVGHMRWATHGDYRNNLNNHPHPADGGWIVHNGVVQNYSALVARWKLMPITECDSEALGLMVERSTGTIGARMARAARLSQGRLAMLGLWGRPGTLVAVRRGNPLHTADAGEGVYLATLDDGLAGAKPMADNQAMTFERRGTKVVIATEKVAATRATTPAGNVARGIRFDESLYCGG